MKNHSIYKQKISYICIPNQFTGSWQASTSIFPFARHAASIAISTPPTRSELKSRYIHALCKELQMRKEYLRGEPVETIYFGGGTPLTACRKRISAKYLKPSGNTMEWNTAGRLPSKLIPTT